MIPDEESAKLASALEDLLGASNQANRIEPGNPLAEWAAGRLGIGRDEAAVIIFELIREITFLEQEETSHYRLLLVARHLLGFVPTNGRDDQIIPGSTRTLKQVRNGQTEKTTALNPTTNTGLRKAIALTFHTSTDRSNLNRGKPLPRAIAAAIARELDQAVLAKDLPDIRDRITGRGLVAARSVRSATPATPPAATVLLARRRPWVSMPRVLMSGGLIAVALCVASYVLGLTSAGTSGGSGPVVSNPHVEWVDVKAGRYVLSGDIRGLELGQDVWNLSTVVPKQAGPLSFAPQPGPCALRGTRFTCPLAYAGRAIADVGATVRVLAVVADGEGEVQLVNYFNDGLRYSSEVNVPRAAGLHTITKVDTVRR